MTAETTQIYIQIAKVQAKRRDNWLPGYPLDEEMEKEHQRELADLRKMLEATLPASIKPQKGLVKSILKKISNLFTKKTA